MLPALTIDTIDSTLASPQPVAVYFTSPTCSHCRMVTPLLDSMVDEYADRMAIFKVEVEDVAQWCQDLNIRSIPRIVVFAGGKEVRRFDARTRNDMRRELDSAHQAALAHIASQAVQPQPPQTAQGDQADQANKTDKTDGPEQSDQSTLTVPQGSAETPVSSTTSGADANGTNPTTSG